MKIRKKWQLLPEKGLLTNYLEIKRYKKAIPFLIGKRILDIGCNEGSLKRFLSPNKEYVGIDITSPKKNDFVFFKRSCLQDLTDLGQFDSIAFLAVIEHLEDNSLKNISKLLKKNGNIVVTTPSKFGNFLHYNLAKIGLTSKEAKEDHKKIFSLNELARVIEKAGFKIIKKRTFMFGTNQLVVGKVD